jgi:hypothetical protein
MSLQDQKTAGGAIEKCLDEIDDFVETLNRYPATTVAIALSVLLQSVLRSRLECDICTRTQVCELIRELERDVLEEGEK